MLTRYERKLADYWANWKPGMGIYKGYTVEWEEPKPMETVHNSDSYFIDDLIDTLKDLI